MVHGTLGVISTIHNCIDGKFEAWEEQCQGHTVLEQQQQKCGTCSKDKDPSQAFEKQHSEELTGICSSPQSPTCLYVSVLYFEAVTETSSSTELQTLPIGPLRTVLGLIWSLPQLLGLELVLFLSLLALSYLGFLTRPVWATPVLAVI